MFVEQVVKRVASTWIMGGSVGSCVYSASQTSRNRLYVGMKDGHRLTSHCYFWFQVGTNLRRASNRVAYGKKVLRVTSAETSQPEQQTGEKNVNDKVT
jgi:hypothetical protein